MKGLYNKLEENIKRQPVEILPDNNLDA